MRRLWTAFRWTTRRAAPILSSLLATIMLVVGVWSIFSPVYFEWGSESKNLIYSYSGDGLFRIVWLRSDKPLQLIPGPSIERSHTDKFYRDYRNVTIETTVGFDYLPLTMRQPTPSVLRQVTGSWISAYFDIQLKTTMAFMSMNGSSLPISRSSLRAPFWALIPLLYVSPYLMFIYAPARRRRRRRRGLCVQCAYDLRGNISGRCSECGTGTDSKVGPT